MTQQPDTAPTDPRHAELTHDAAALVVRHLVVDDADVVAEARRWTTGVRSARVDHPAALAQADLSAYVVSALRVGARAIAATGVAQETQALQQLLAEVGERSAAGSLQAAELTSRIVQEASATVTKAAEQARQSMADAEATGRRQFTASVVEAKGELQAEVRRLFGGESPELLDRLQPLLDRFGSQLDATVSRQTADLLTKAARQFDPADPTSPMAKHTARLDADQSKLADLLDRQHTDLTRKVDELATAVQVQQARTTLASVTPITGDSYATRLHTVLDGIAVGLGDEYADTGAVTGRLPRCKKGDGVLTIDGGPTRVVVEMTDSDRRTWGDYLDEAERNREAAASLGLVRTAAQNGGRTVRILGGRRVVLAFDPQTDDPDLSSLAASRRARKGSRPSPLPSPPASAGCSARRRPRWRMWSPPTRLLAPT